MSDREPPAFWRLIVSHPKTVLALFVACAAVLSWQARNFRIDASADTLLTEDNVHFIESQIVNRRFSPEEFVLVAYEPHDWPVLSSRSFADLEAISGRLRKLERVASVRSILDVPLLELAGAGLSDDIDPDAWTIAGNDFPVAELERVFRGHPIYEDLLINRQQTAAAIQVVFAADAALDELQARIVELQTARLSGELSAAQQHELEELQERADPLQQRLDRDRAGEIAEIRALVDDYTDDANIYLGGVHVLGFELVEIVKHDLVVFGAAIAAMICVVLLVVFRRLRWVAIPAICCICSVASTIGLFGLLDFRATVISANFIALQIILTLAIVVHLIVQYREYGRQQPTWGQAELVTRTVARKAAPCFYAALTTSVGFASLLFSGIQPVIAFGWMMIVVMTISTAVSLILFPAIMALFDREQIAERHRITRSVLDFFARVALRRGALVVLLGIGLAAGSVAGALRLDVENSFIDYFKDSTRVHRELTFIDRHLGGSTPLDVIYTIPDSEKKQDLVLTAATVQQMQRVQKLFGQHEGVGKILSVVNFTELAKNLNAGKPLTEYELTAVYWTLDKAVRERLVGAYFRPETSQLRFNLRIMDSTPDLRRGELLEALRADLARLEIAESDYKMTNLFVLYEDLLRQLFRSQILTLGLVFAMLGLTFLLIFRSVSIAFIALAPNVLSTGIVLGFMGWAGIPLDFMTVTIAAIAMGIAVDDTIHYIDRYREELPGGSPDEAVQRTHGSVGYAILYTTLIVTLGFSLLAFSDFVPSILFGLLTSLAMVIALVSNVALVPVLLRRFVR
jgi:hypothetical protein